MRYSIAFRNSTSEILSFAQNPAVFFIQPGIISDSALIVIGTAAKVTITANVRIKIDFCCI